MNGHTLPSGENLSVIKYQPREKKPTNISGASPSSFVCNNLYVKNFPTPHFDEFEL